MGRLGDRRKNRHPQEEMMKIMFEADKAGWEEERYGRLAERHSAELAAPRCRLSDSHQRRQ
jgi:hypothetical protein